MANIHIIRKYPNRRLYDTHVSRYVTLDDVRNLVVANEDFRVIDKRTDTDITRTILLQIISEQEEGDEPIFHTEVLRKIIRYYGDSMQGTMSSYLELSLDLFNEQQHQFRDRLRGMLNAHRPLAVLRELSKEQAPIWRSVRRQYLKNLNGRGNDRHDSGD